MKKDKNTSKVITNDNAVDKSKIGYVRVSTVEQNESRQLEAFKDLDLYKIFIEKISAKDRMNVVKVFFENPICVSSKCVDASNFTL